MIVPVHPRMRGEHSHHSAPPVTGAGSSPHARGTHPIGRGNDDFIRFIPACAGNTPPTIWPQPSRPVHPRMRGEHGAGSFTATAMSGSSPHARGTRRRAHAWQRVGRFIPACAGNTVAAPVAVSQFTVHPRMRGEHAKRTFCDGYATGSSPHARGTPTPLYRECLDRRFIPACAGNTNHSSI